MEQGYWQFASIDISWGTSTERPKVEMTTLTRVKASDPLPFSQLPERDYLLNFPLLSKDEGLYVEMETPAHTWVPLKAVTLLIPEK